MAQGVDDVGQEVVIVGQEVALVEQEVEVEGQDLALVGREVALVDTRSHWASHNRMFLPVFTSEAYFGLQHSQFLRAPSHSIDSV